MADYGGFGGIIQAAQSIAEENQRLDDAPMACPKCGLVLDINSRGVRNCRMGHFRHGG